MASNASLLEIQQKILKKVISGTVKAISEKSGTSEHRIELDRPIIQFTKDVGITISVLIEMHKSLDLEFDLDLNRVESDFKTAQDIVEYLMSRILSTVSNTALKQH